RITEPVFHFDIRVDETANGEYEVWDHFYDPLEPSIDTEVTDPRGTDRRAVADEAISVSPLSVQHQTITAAVFEQWSEQYD
ncbi:MAG: 5'/3'-nucleotidase SurE, partial [Halobacteriaceae archaeon]